MSYQELVLEVNHLSLDERLRLLNVITQSIRADLKPPPRVGSSLERVRGLLKPNGPMPTDDELDEMVVQSLMASV